MDESPVEVSPAVGLVIDLLGECQEVMLERDKQYHGSFVHQGADGLLYDMLRKFRRLWFKVMSQQIPDRNETEDLANHALMLQALVELDPNSLQNMRVVSAVPFPVSSKYDPDDGFE